MRSMPVLWFALVGCARPTGDSADPPAPVEPTELAVRLSSSFGWDASEASMVDVVVPGLSFR